MSEIYTNNRPIKLDPSYVGHNTKDEHSQIFTEYVRGRVASVFKGSEYEKMNVVNPDDGKFHRLNKLDINKVYMFADAQLPDIPCIELFAAISEFFDIKPTKLYNSLSNTYKNQLLEELETRGFYENDMKLF